MSASNEMAIDFLSPEFRANPYPYYEMMRMGAPIFYLESWNMWFCTRYEDCAALLRDNRLGHGILKVTTAEQARLNPLEDLPESHQKRARMQGKWILFRDPPDHTRLRGLVHKAFTPRMVNRLQGHIEAITDQLLDAALERGTLDIISDFAILLPLQVIAEMLGVPMEDRVRFKAWSDALAGTLDIVGDDPDLWENAAQASEEFDIYFRDLAEQRRANPQEDMLTALVQAENEGDTLTEDELVATCIMLLIAGHETTVNLIGNGVLALLQNPDQLEKLKADPSLVRNAVEEFMRFDSPVQMTRRWVLEAFEYKGQQFEVGQQVAMMFGAANRDPAMFDDPATLDITRANASKHMAFGNGIHFCVGAPLARLEGHIAFNKLLEKMPNIQLAPDAEIVHRKQYILRGVRSLPVTF